MGWDVDWSDLGTALGLALAIEGALYALAPSAMRRLMARVLDREQASLRIAGVAAVVTGVAIVWFIRS